MIHVRFLNTTQNRDEPNEFASWHQFYVYLKERWDYSPTNFRTGATKLSDRLFRFVTWKFVMIVEEKDDDSQSDSSV